MGEAGAVREVRRQEVRTAHRLRGVAVRVAAGEGREVNFRSGSSLYYISFLGKPSMGSPWMLQFGGHHLALNVTMAGSQGVMMPTLTGAQPASFQLDGKTVRPVGRESDKALALLQSLDEKQRKQAVLNYQVADLVLGPGQDGKKIAPEGLKVSAMNEKQRAMVLDVIGEWAGILNDGAAAARMAELKADLNETWFAWSGATAAEPGSNITAYYRIQGPHLVIEYAPQRDEPTNHVHYRCIAIPRERLRTCAPKQMTTFHTGRSRRQFLSSVSMAAVAGIILRPRSSWAADTADPRVAEIIATTLGIDTHNHIDVLAHCRRNAWPRY